MANQKATVTPHFFAVPVLLMRGLKLDPPKGGVRMMAPAVIEDFDIGVDVFAFLTRKARAKAIADLKKAAAGKGVELVPAVGTVSGAASDILVAATSKHERRDIADPPDGENFLTFKSYIESDLKQVEKFSRFTGLCVVYCHAGSIAQPSFPDQPGTVYLLQHHRPPGLWDRTMEVKDLFGIEVWKQGETRLVGSPTQGRGRVIEENGTCVFQVIGRNYYQLCLVHCELHEPPNREAIFRKLLGRLGRDLVENEGRKPERLPDTTDEELAAFGSEQAGRVLADLGKELGKTEAEVRRLEEELSGKLRERQGQIVRLKAMADSEFVRDLHERLPREFGAIRGIEGVAGVRLVDGGIHVETDPVVLEHRGRRYGLGPFIIRLDMSGKVEVWSEKPLHPKGHHHPHIDRVNLACYGNVTIAIDKFMSAYRFADAARLVMRWLKTYSPETTLIPIEEWPLVDQTETRKENKNVGTGPEPVATA